MEKVKICFDFYAVWYFWNKRKGTIQFLSTLLYREQYYDFECLYDADETQKCMLGYLSNQLA